MYLKNDAITVTIGNTVMRSSRMGTPKDFVLDPTAITGWTDGTAVRRDSTVRPVSNGDFYDTAVMSARVISISGTAIASNRVLLQEMRDDLVGMLANGKYGEMSVSTGAGTRYATVGLEGTTSWIQQLDNVALWKIDLFAPDPCIYGPQQIINIGAYTTSGGGLDYILKYPLRYNSNSQTKTASSITNKGNVDAWPVFVVTGDYFSGFTITDNQDNRVTYNGTVTMNAPVEIDMGKGTAMQNGVDKSVLLSERNWISVPPQEVVRPSFTPLQSGSGWCDIMIRDTWI